MLESQVEMLPPVVTPTPYGGRLTWTLPGKTIFVAHLKDKSKIRHLKRWSQVILSIGVSLLGEHEHEQEHSVGT